MIDLEQYNSDPLQQFTTTEEISMELAAFIGGLDDLFEAFAGSAPDRSADSQIMLQVNAIRDTTSEHYSIVRAQLLDRFEEMAHMACQNEQFRESFERYFGQHLDGSLEHDAAKDDKKSKKKNNHYISIFGIMVVAR